MVALFGEPGKLSVHAEFKGANRIKAKNRFLQQLLIDQQGGQSKMFHKKRKLKTFIRFIDTVTGGLQTPVR